MTFVKLKEQYPGRHQRAGDSQHGGTQPDGERRGATLPRGRSFTYGQPTGPLVVCMFGLLLVVTFILRRLIGGSAPA